MKNKKVNKFIKISLLVGANYIICGILLTILESKNIFFTLFLGEGIFFSRYTLQKTQKLLYKSYGKRISI